MEIVHIIVKENPKPVYLYRLLHSPMVTNLVSVVQSIRNQLDIKGTKRCEMDTSRSLPSNWKNNHLGLQYDDD